MPSGSIAVLLVPPSARPEAGAVGEVVGGAEGDRARVAAQAQAAGGAR
ncbi:MAG: hypothetical protein HS111_30975 [Kofleriaceae bacterium]|nr:hypothetical protein [Kofleriaceae bacterium]